MLYFHILRLLPQEKALSRSQELFDQADTSKDGKLQLGEVRDILRKSSEEYSHFAEHARFLDGCGLSLTSPICRWAIYKGILQDFQHVLGGWALIAHVQVS